MRLISSALALAAMSTLTACGGDKDARAGNVTVQEADGLNAAAAMVDERTERTENALRNPEPSAENQAPAAPKEQAKEPPKELAKEPAKETAKEPPKVPPKQ